MQPARRLLGLASLLLTVALLAQPSIAGTAKQSSTTLYTSQEIGGLVFDLALPKSWHVLMGDGGSFTLTSTDANEASGTAQLNVRVFAAPGGPDGSDKPTVDLLTLRSTLLDRVMPYLDPKIFRESKQQVAGIEMIRREINRSKVTNAEGKLVAPSAPDAWVLVGAGKRGHGIIIRAHGQGGNAAGNTAALAHHAKTLEAMLGSIRIWRYSQLTDEERASLPRLHTAKAARVSSRGRFYFDIQPTIYLHPGWTANEFLRDPAGGEYEQGRFATEFAPPTPAGQPSEVVALLLLDGMPVGPLSAGDYLKTIDPVVEGMLPGAKRIAETKFLHPGFRRLAGIATRWTTPTGATYVRVYEGVDESGKTIQLHTYTAGGLTGTAHLIFIAPKDQYPDYAKQFKALLGSLRLFLTSPSL